jgi:hypothetical protein
LSPFLIKKQKKDLRKFAFPGKSIGVIAGSFEETYMRNTSVKSTKIMPFPSNDAIVASLLNRSKISGEEIDVLFINIHTARNMVAKYRELKLQALGEKREITIQTQRDSPLLKVLNRRVKKLVWSQKFSELERRWTLERFRFEDL